MAADGYAPKTLRELGKRRECAGISFVQLAQAALVLAGMGSLHPVQPRAAIDSATPHCKSLNAHLLERSLASGDIEALASPLTGAGVFMARVEMLFLRAISRGHANPEDWARCALEWLGEGDPDGLRSNASAFERIRLPVLRALGVA